MTLEVKEGPQGVTFKLKVVPRAKTSMIEGEYGTGLKVRIHAPPVDGKANKEVVRLLAETLGVRTEEVEILAGLSSTGKTVMIRGLSAGQLRERLKLAGTPGTE